jgi:hypothetical protein
MSKKGSFLHLLIDAMILIAFSEFYVVYSETLIRFARGFQKETTYIS